MKRAERKSFELPTYSVLAGPSGEILDVGAHHLPEGAEAPKLKGSNYPEQCAAAYRPAIKALLARKRQLLSAVMPPPTLKFDAWFAVVGVPLGESEDAGALFVHMDISPWVMANGREGVPKEISMDLLQKAMTTTFISSPSTKSLHRNADDRYEGVGSLSPRQLEVLKLIGEGMTNVEIADALSCSLNTVKRHVTAVLQKLKLPNRTKAAMLANTLDLVRASS